MTSILNNTLPLKTTRYSSSQMEASTYQAQTAKMPTSVNNPDIPHLTVALSPDAEGSLSVEPNGKPGVFHLMVTQGNKTRSAGIICNVKNQDITAHITKNGLVVDVNTKSVGQRYFIFPGGEYRSGSSLFIKLWPQQNNNDPRREKRLPSEDFKQAISHQALVPVGGQATRLAPLTQLVPKPAIPIAADGQTLIGRVVESLKDHGINHVLVTTRVMPDLIRQALKTLKPGKPLVTYVQEHNALGDIGSLLNMLKDPSRYGLDVNKPLLVVQGDAYTNVNFSKLLNAHQKNNAALTFAFKEVPDDQVDQFGIIETDKTDKDGLSGRILRFIEKPKPSDTPCRNANTGIMVLGPEVLAILPDCHKAAGNPEKVNFAVHIMPQLMSRLEAGDIKNRKGQPLYPWAERATSDWHDVGRPNSYFNIHEGRDNRGTVFWPGAKDHHAITVAGNVVALKSSK
jgi:NDP-sugar pyrophosphorylase family protein